MNEKTAVNDILSNINTMITMITYSIQQANNETFRNNLIDYRAKLDSLEFEVYTLAKNKNYYIPAAPAGEADIEQVKNIVCK